MAFLGERLKIALKNKNMKQSVLAYRLGVDRSYITNYISGRYSPKTDILHKMAEILNVSPAWLLGYDVPMHEDDTRFENNSSLEEYGLRPVRLKRFPMLGEIACGQPIFANEEHESYIDASANIEADFCLTARGDSMIGVRINDGDIVFIKKQSIVRNGEIAAVIIDDEATLKTWFYYPEKQKLVLTPANQNYEPLVYVGSELETITCLGKAVCFMSKI